MPKINRDDLNHLHVVMAPPKEQEKIAEILSTWDEGIEQMRRLIDAKKHRKKALIQQLLTGKKRLPGFGGEWVERPLGDLLREVSRPVKFNDDDNYDLISVRRRSQGIFHRETICGRNIKTKQLYHARKGDFLISKMQILHGASAVVSSQFDGMQISGSYIALRARDEDQLDVSFLDWLSNTPIFYHLTYLASYGVHIEKMTFNLGFFLKSEIRIPSDVDEQIAIVEVLKTVSEEIQMLDDNVTSLEKLKRGLMQKLLTGNIRVKV